jgi:hypothetical protein
MLLGVYTCCYLVEHQTVRVDKEELLPIVGRHFHRDVSMDHVLLKVLKVSTRVSSVKGEYTSQ